MKRPLISLLLVAGTLAALPAHADDEPIGRWRYKLDDRAVKVVVIGGSIASWARGNFGDFLQHACKNIELKNRAKTGYGAWALKRRFRQQFIRNRHIKLRDNDGRFEYWLLYSGGLNSISTPEMTIHHTVDTFTLAHRHNVRVAALTLTPWGAESDRRWRGFDGLTYLEKTIKVVDYILGKLARNVALGRYAADAPDQAEWAEGELPDIGIDVFNGPLMNTAATARPVEPLARLYDRRRALQRQYPDREQALERASRLPQWFMKPALRAFDHIHPNSEGHRLMARAACPRLPESWGCDCPLIDRLRWQGGSVVEP